MSSEKQESYTFSYIVIAVSIFIMCAHTFYVEPILLPLLGL